MKIILNIAIYALLIGLFVSIPHFFVPAMIMSSFIINKLTNMVL